MWGKKSESKEANQSRPGGIDFETAADRVTAEGRIAADGLRAVGFEDHAEAIEEAAAGESDEDALIIKPEWALAVSKGCFYPAARWIHPAYSLNDEEAATINPKMQIFLQTVADKYAPAAISRLANRFPEFWDLVAVLGVLYYQKYRVVSKVMAEEAKAAESAKRVAGSHVAVMPTPAVVFDEPEEKVIGGRLRDGTLVI